MQFRSGRCCCSRNYRHFFIGLVSSRRRASYLSLLFGWLCLCLGQSWRCAFLRRCWPKWSRLQIQARLTKWLVFHSQSHESLPLVPRSFNLLWTRRSCHLRCTVCHWLCQLLYPTPPCITSKAGMFGRFWTPVYLSQAHKLHVKCM